MNTPLRRLAALGLAAETGRKAAEMSCAAIERFIRRIGLDRKLHELRVPEEELAAFLLEKEVAARDAALLGVKK